MDRFEDLRRFLCRFNCLTEAEISLIISHFGQTALKKDEYYFKAGACCSHLSYLVGGILGVLAPGDRGEEKVRYFVTENQFFTDPDGFKPGGYACKSFQAMVPCALLSIPVCEAEKLGRKIPAFASVIRQIREQSLIYIIKHQDFVLTGSPAFQYRRMFEELPEVVKHVALKYIASYLGIDQATLSRIRRKCR